MRRSLLSAGLVLIAIAGACGVKPWHHRQKCRVRFLELSFYIKPDASPSRFRVYIFPGLYGKAPELFT